MLVRTDLRRRALPGVLALCVGHFLLACIVAPLDDQSAYRVSAPATSASPPRTPSPPAAPKARATQTKVQPDRPSLPPRAEESLDATVAETVAGQRVLALIGVLKDAVKTTRYQGSTSIDAKEGSYAWDCSGMTGWILAKTAPTARRTVGEGRQRAKDFYRAIANAPVDRPKKGWQRLAHVSDARPGDVFAFLKSKLSNSKITGHVGFLLEQPWPIPGLSNAWAARILDATSLPHQDDTRSMEGEGGFGFGTFMFVTDDTGATIGYGWFGTESRGYLPTEVIYGRVHK